MDARRRLLDSERRSPENAHTGLLDALVVGGDLSPEEAASAVAKAERTEQPTREVYRWLQTLIAPQRLVNKSPENARLLQILARGERWFHDALYIHLVRSPAAMIQSCKEIGISWAIRRAGLLPGSGLNCSGSRNRGSSSPSSFQFQRSARP